MYAEAVHSFLDGSSDGKAHVEATEEKRCKLPARLDVVDSTLLHISGTTVHGWRSRCVILLLITSMIKDTKRDNVEEKEFSVDDPKTSMLLLLMMMMRRRRRRRRNAPSM